MKFKKLLGALAVSSAFMAGTASATPFTIDVAAFGSAGAGSDGNTLTSLISRLNLVWDATSVYTDNLVNPLGGVGVLNLGDFVTDSGEGGIGYIGLDGDPIVGSNANEGLGNAYSLTFTYDNLMGFVNFVGTPGTEFENVIGAEYQSGTIKMFANLIDDDGVISSTEEVMTLGVTGSGGTLGNFDLFTKILTVKENVFFLNGVTDFNDIIVIQAKNIAGTTDFNNPPEAVSIVVGLPGAPAQWERTTELTGDLRFSVPEPGALALLGLGLLGLAAVRRNKKVA